jgi:hypothetical protein
LNKIAEEYSAKLKFVTREEYLAWVKQWKEDYKLIEKHHKITKYTERQAKCILPKKVEYYKNKLDKVPKLSPSEVLRLKTLEAQYLNDFGLRPWFVVSEYLVWYMLIMRKAGKLRAKQQRDIRIQQAVLV